MTIGSRHWTPNFCSIHAKTHAGYANDAKALSALLLSEAEACAQQQEM